MKEEWRDVKGFEDSYEVSNLGRVKGKLRRVEAKNFKGTTYVRVLPAKFLKPKDNGCGYLRVLLTQDKNKQNRYIHRLVAESFLSNPDNLPEVNHRDQDKYNNCVSNLEWISRADNVNYGDRTERAARTRSRTIKIMKLCNNYLTMDSSTNSDTQLAILWDI